MHAGGPTFGAASGTRTSDSWFLRYRAVPSFLDKVANLLGSVDKTHFEEPQLVRLVCFGEREDMEGYTILKTLAVIFLVI